MESNIRITENSQMGKARIMLLWLGIASICMMFGGFTSAYIVSQGTKGWLKFQLPNIFLISTIVVLLSSATMIFAFNGAKNNKSNQVKIGLGITFILGLIFCFFQFKGWGILFENGIYFLGSKSRSSGSYLYIFTGVHMAHILSGLIMLLYCFLMSLKGKYHTKNMLGLKMAAIYWHFLDILWVYLFLFLYFIR